MQHASVQWPIVSIQRNEEAWEYFSHVQEMLVVEVVSFW